MKEEIRKVSYEHISNYNEMTIVQFNSYLGNSHHYLPNIRSLENIENVYAPCTDNLICYFKVKKK